MVSAEIWQNVHPSSLKKFNKLTNVPELKRTAGDAAGGDRLKQARLSWSNSKPSSKINQENFQSLVLNFVTDTLLPCQLWNNQVSRSFLFPSIFQ